MWRTSSGNRILSDPEWSVFRAGLSQLFEDVICDIEDGLDDVETGVTCFDHLTAEQKLVQLAEVAVALRDPTVPYPHHTATNEGAIAAVLNASKEMLQFEIEENDPNVTYMRRAFLNVMAEVDEEDRDELPDVTNGEWESWDFLSDCLTYRIFWDSDYEMGNCFLDLPHEVARVELEAAGIDPDYFLTTPNEPTKQELFQARQTLAILIGRGEMV